eukprot:scaffold2405_cov21-Tisochrysis_lutea.AAC.2
MLEGGSIVRNTDGVCKRKVLSGSRLPSLMCCGLLKLSGNAGPGALSQKCVGKGHSDTDTHTFTHARAHTHAHMHTRTHTHTQTHTYTYTAPCSKSRRLRGRCLPVESVLESNYEDSEEGWRDSDEEGAGTEVSQPARMSATDKMQQRPVCALGRFGQGAEGVVMCVCCAVVVWIWLCVCQCVKGEGGR